MDDTVLVEEISSGRITPEILKYSVPLLYASLLSPLTSKLPLGKTLTTVTEIVPDKLLACAAVPLPVNDCVVPPWRFPSFTPSLKKNFPKKEDGPKIASGKSKT